MQLTKEHRSTAKQNGISTNLLNQRITTLGWDIETAITKRVQRRNEIRASVQYAVYRGDEFVCMGTAKEYSDFMGIKQSSFYHYLTPSYERRIKERKPKKYTSVVEV